MKRSLWTSLMLTLAMPLFVASVPAQDTPSAAATAARADTEEALRTEQGTQQAADRWDAERQALEQRYRQADADGKWLAGRVARERDATAALEAKKTELERRLVESERLTDNLEDTLAVLVERLDGAVAADLPFLAEERAGRLASLRAALGDPDAPAAEKLRRVLEAFQVEAGYGGTVEIISQRISLDDAEIHVDLLRLGRLALLWRTPDGARAGIYDQGRAAWVEVDRSGRQAIGRAMEMAARMRPVAVIGLPLGRIER